MKVNDVNQGIKKNRRRLRIGRGPGSGRGKTSGRGHKGQGQLAGWSAAGIFEGARMPLIRQIPKRGFHNRHARIVTCVNVDDLEARFTAGAEVSPDTLRTVGLAKGVWDSVKILGEGSLTKPLKVSAHHFSGQAREKILAAGGTVSDIAGPAAVVKRQKKVSKKQTAKK